MYSYQGRVNGEVPVGNVDGHIHRLNRLRSYSKYYSGKELKSFKPYKIKFDLLKDVSELEMLQQKAVAIVDMIRIPLSRIKLHKKIEQINMTISLLTNI